MIKVEKICVTGWEASIRGMRNPMNSWDKSDSKWVKCSPEEEKETGETYYYKVGPADLDLMHRLYLGGPEHRKYLRMLHISMDITAPLYWWKEFDTYKVGTTANSCSTMHKIYAKNFALEDFSTDHLIYGEGTGVLRGVIKALNVYRSHYLLTKDKIYWWQLIQLLPSTYNQRRTVDFSYETAVTIIHQRKGHKLDEWNKLVSILMDLPYMREISEATQQ